MNIFVSGIELVLLTIRLVFGIILNSHRGPGNPGCIDS